MCNDDKELFYSILIFDNKLILLLCRLIQQKALCVVSLWLLFFQKLIIKFCLLDVGLWICCGEEEQEVQCSLICLQKLIFCHFICWKLAIEEEGLYLSTLSLSTILACLCSLKLYMQLTMKALKVLLISAFIPPLSTGCKVISFRASKWRGIKSTVFAQCRNPYSTQRPNIKIREPKLAKWNGDLLKVHFN